MTGRPLSGAVVEGIDFSRWSVVLCKPDAVKRGLVDTVLERITETGITIVHREEIVAQAWQAHVHYWDLLVDRHRYPGRDVPACLDAEYAGRTVVVALAHGEPGVQARLRAVLGHFDPTEAAPGTIRGDLGDDSLRAALAESRLVRNLVHTSDDETAARRDFGTWYGVGHRDLLTPALPAQSTPVEA
ncbi:nucleoside-diphosphate kinase [Streptomyces sp. NPDC057499]|uniref:nucleoside-diphosphate kinase n=1 Tax=Streptomyces sp. NPDC057499 TaxID=3346150 RepID=UPI00367D83B2